MAVAIKGEQKKKCAETPPPPVVSEDDVDMLDVEETCTDEVEEVKTDENEEDKVPSNTITLHVGPNKGRMFGPKIIFSAPVPNSSMYFGCGWR